MLTFPRLSRFMLASAVVFAMASIAQAQSSRPSSIRSTERVARASWQPVRSSSPQVDADAGAVSSKQLKTSQDTPAGTANQSKSTDTDTSAGRTHAVRQAGHSIPAPPADSMSSVIQGPMIGEPLDGQIALSPMHAPMHGGAMACDAMPMGAGCGCDGFAQGACESCRVAVGSYDPCCGELCSADVWRPLVTISLPQDGWVSFEYLAWWQDGMGLPPLVTTSADPNVARTNAGVLGQPTTRTLFGGGDVLTDHFDGGRLRFGIWLDKCHTWSVAGEFFKIGSESESFFANSSGDPILARPFFNVNPAAGLPREDSELAAFPGVVSGAIGATARSELAGGGFHFRNLRNGSEGCNRWLLDSCEQPYCSRTEALFGYRFLQLTESVTISENLTGINPASTFAIDDRFRTRNQFNGVDIGWIYRQTRMNWTFDGMLRLAVGSTRQTVNINGSTVITEPGQTPAAFSAGVLAQASNIGEYKRDEFSVIPELNLNLGYQLNDHWRVMFGYTFIYWSNVVRPGEHISRDLNPSQLPPAEDPLPGAARPGFKFDSVDYWVQGISTGLEYRW